MSSWNSQANYKNSQDQIAASSNPFNTILGAATGVGSAYALNKFG
jgi:ribose 5-phosphate isomerase RpiB